MEKNKLFLIKSKEGGTEYPHGEELRKRAEEEINKYLGCYFQIPLWLVNKAGINVEEKLDSYYEYDDNYLIMFDREEVSLEEKAKIFEHYTNGIFRSQNYKGDLIVNHGNTKKYLENKINKVKDIASNLTFEKVLGFNFRELESEINDSYGDRVLFLCGKGEGSFIEYPLEKYLIETAIFDIKIGRNYTIELVDIFEI
jgi:hypothetical protein